MKDIVKNNIKGCIFDLDGTLTNTLESLTYSVNLTLKKMELSEITPDQCRRFVGNGTKILMERALKVSGDETAQRLGEGMELFDKIFHENCTYHVTPYDGIQSLLNMLKSKDMKLAVLTNKPHGQAVDVVKNIFGENIFDFIQGQTDTMPKKPDPAGAKYLLEKMNLDKRECLYIGDSEVDIATGIAAEIKCIGVTWGFRDREVLLEAGAVNLIDDPAELSKYIFSSC